MPDLARMRKDRHAKLEREMEHAGVEGMVLLGRGAVCYATGALIAACDPSRSLWDRPVAVLKRGAGAPHIFTSHGEEVPAGHLHGPLRPELDDGTQAFADALSELFDTGSRVAVDELPHSARPAFRRFDVVPASGLLASARLCKTRDELACIREAQRINEAAMAEVYRRLRPGVRQNDLTAALLRLVHQLGATSSVVDPVWHVVPMSIAHGAWTTHGGVAFPAPSSDRFLRDGDVLWVQSALSFQGYSSAFARTWIVGRRPSGRQLSQFARWKDVLAAVLETCKPGATALDLCEAARAVEAGGTPWLAHRYLARGTGADPVEMPLVGTDLGEQFDARMVLRPGMVLVLEPVVWDDGAGGYRAEDVYAVTDAGSVELSAHPYDPFGAR